MTLTTLDTLPTPALILDRDKVVRNVFALRARLDTLGVTLRPHVKTSKSIEVARLMAGSASGPITVSTLREAEHFAAAGWTDMIYAVGIAPDKLPRIQRLLESGVDIAVLLDTEDQARALSRLGAGGRRVPAALIEIDCDGHRGGLAPDDPRLLSISSLLASNGVELRGVLTHAGASYDGRTAADMADAAERERAAATAAADTLRRCGHALTIVSVGSTPTAHGAQQLAGVTEVRAGVFAFFDLVMHGIGVCEVYDIALSVLGTVIGHQRHRGWVIVDAGWTAMSRDRGTARQAIDQGYGLVCDLEGVPYTDLIMVEANQEHGILAVRPGASSPLPELPVGSRVRILPNHACATGAQHDFYSVVQGGRRDVIATWNRTRGW